MKIYLYTNTNIINFVLPDTVSGSFSFDENSNETNKLINVEAIGGRWYLYTTEDVKVKQDGNIIDKVALDDGVFYTIVRNGIEYLIQANETRNNVVHIYSYGQNMNLAIGNAAGYTAVYDCPQLINENVTISYVNNALSIQKKADTKVYINNIRETSFVKTLNNGDVINIFGFRLMILPNIIVMCFSGNRVNILSSANLKLLNVKEQDLPEDVPLKDIGLYDNVPFFSKSPRIRRTVEHQSFKLSDPPELRNKPNSVLLTLIPMLTMGFTSVLMLFNTINSIKTGQAKVENVWPNLVTSSLMIVTSLVWPLISRLIENYKIKKNKERVIKRYNDYLKEKEAELIEATKVQREIMLENLLTTTECIDMIQNKRFPFWNKRSDQKDFLSVRVGIGNVPLEVSIEDPDKGFKIEEDFLEKFVIELKEKYKYIKDMPISYSFNDNRVTAIMGQRNTCNAFVNNLILQLISFYSYEDLKLVVFTDEIWESNWDYLKYLNHNFNDDMTFRYFSSTDETAKEVINQLRSVLASRTAKDPEKTKYKPHYLIIVDDYDRIKRYNFIKDLTELNQNYGFSVVFIENRFSKLPSKCNNFITLGEKTSGILTNAYEKQEQIDFRAEIKYGINMMEVAKVVSNIPIEFEKGVIDKLPESISFLELEKVGKVEQLNIINRWKKNDPTTSLKAEVGINGQGDILYLDLHEKYHGPHGLIAGMTGSGKSEFIITYILSMAINYSPDDVSFILIDYKGGGLAFAFENKLTHKVLPHLSGTITNLDKAEMDRTLVSIDSELQRRQKMFNSARDAVGESTMDIYKYQRLYKEGKITEPISHLIIICDEFAELKTNQPEFMESLISTARIGRSLGVHLILATQKPSGVVNEQIWSNTKFRVCLKVQDESDSREMLKRPEAASLKEAGRFYLQVGYDEYFALGQSAWCGAKYFPSDKIVKTIDRNIDFINDCGLVIKTMQYSTERKVQAEGEQIVSILDNIIISADQLKQKARKLWLDNIPAVILVDDIEKKYSYAATKFHVEATVGEYDTPERQEQGIVTYDYVNDGNLLIYGNDSAEREMILKTMIYSTTRYHMPDEVNYYLIDYGSESLKGFERLPHFGGSVYSGEDEKFANLIKMINTSVRKRKEILSAYGGDYVNYIKNTPNPTIPVMTIIFNNFDSIYEGNQQLYETLPELTRDSERYGVVFWFTCGAVGSITGKVASNFHTIYAFKLKDAGDYNSLFDTRNTKPPRDIIGRGVLKIGTTHEFQTASIVEDPSTLNEFIVDYANNYNILDDYKAVKIPTLPSIVTYDYIKNDIKGLDRVPIAIVKSSLDIYKYNFLQNQGNIVSSNRLENTQRFVYSLLHVLRQIQNNRLIILDATKDLQLNKEEYPIVINDQFDAVSPELEKMIKKYTEQNEFPTITILVYGLDKLLSSFQEPRAFDNLVNVVKTYDKATIIVAEAAGKVKNYTFESWFPKVFSVNDGIWVGKGLGDQTLFRLSKIDKTMSENYPGDMGFVISEGYTSLVKYIDFMPRGEEKDE
jgi:S-DNA-T family DNA segregation ATPase FtsK/SpoIIIE